MKLLRKVGATSEIWQVFVGDSSSTTGAGLTGLVFNSASLTAYYHRDTDATATVISLATMTVGTFTSSGFKEIDATNMPGWYQFCPPNAALASGAKSCGFHLKGATNMVPMPIEVDLQGDVNVTHIAGTASVGAAGYAGVDWGAVTNKTTANALTGTTTADLTSSLTESYAADGAAFTAAQALYEICQSLTEFAISGSTVTVRKRDGSTSALTYTLDSSTAPTSRTRAS